MSTAFDFAECMQLVQGKHSSRCEKVKTTFCIPIQITRSNFIENLTKIRGQEFD